MAVDECLTAPFFVYAGVLFPLIIHTIAGRYLSRFTRGKESRFGLTASHVHNLGLKVARVAHISLMGGIGYAYLVSNLGSEGFVAGVRARQCEWANVSMFVITFDIYELTQISGKGHEARIFHHLLELGIIVSWVISNVSPLIVFAGAQVIVGNTAFIIPVIMRVLPLNKKQLVVAAWACAIIALAPVIVCDIAVLFWLSTNWNKTFLARKVTAITFVIVFTSLDAMLLRNYFWPMIKKARKGLLKSALTSALPMDNTYRMHLTQRNSMKDMVVSADEPAVELMSTTLSSLSSSSLGTPSKSSTRSLQHERTPSYSVRIPVKNDPLNNHNTLTKRSSHTIDDMMSTTTLGSARFSTAASHSHHSMMNDTDISCGDSTTVSTETFNREMSTMRRTPLHVRSYSGVLPHQTSAGFSGSPALSRYASDEYERSSSPSLESPEPIQQPNDAVQTPRHNRLQQLRRSHTSNAIGNLPPRSLSAVEQAISSPLQQPQQDFSAAHFDEQTKHFHGLMSFSQQPLSTEKDDNESYASMPKNARGFTSDAREPQPAPAAPLGDDPKDHIVRV